MEGDINNTNTLSDPTFEVKEEQIDGNINTRSGTPLFKQTSVP